MLLTTGSPPTCLPAPGPGHWGHRHAYLEGLQKPETLVVPLTVGFWDVPGPLE